MARLHVHAITGAVAAGCAAASFTVPGLAEETELQAALDWLNRIGVRDGDTDYSLETLADESYVYFDNDAKRQIVDVDLMHLQALPRLARVDLGGSVTEGLSDAGVAHLAAIPTLESLVLSVTKVGDVGVAYLAGHPSLLEVELPSTLITDAAIDSLITIPGLRKLNVGATAVTDAGLATLASAQTLEVLWLQNVRGISDEGLASVGKLPRLRELVLEISPVNEGLAHLAGLDSLQNLQLMATELDDAGAAYLAGLPSLRQLGLWRTGITDAALAHVAMLSALTTLRLDYTAVTDAGMATIGAMPALETLYLGNTAVGDAGLAALTGLPLRTIDVSRTAVTDAGLATLGGIETLRTITARDNEAVSEDGVAALQRMLPDARIYP